MGVNGVQTAQMMAQVIVKNFGFHDSDEREFDLEMKEKRILNLSGIQMADENDSKLKLNLTQYYFSDGKLVFKLPSLTSRQEVRLTFSLEASADLFTHISEPLPLFTLRFTETEYSPIETELDYMSHYLVQKSPHKSYSQSQ